MEKLKRFKFTIIAVFVAVLFTIIMPEETENREQPSTKEWVTATINSNQSFVPADDNEGTEQSEHSKDNNEDTGTENSKSLYKGVSYKDVPKYNGNPYVIIDDNEPSFKEKEITDASFEEYSSLDSYGRCQAATACVGRDIMPTKKRDSIGQVKPSGWHTVKYDCVDGKYLYNRCHLIGYQLTGENANTKNLITGTRYMNVDGMLPFEDMIADYVKETDNHVMYRVTPIYKKKNLVASGVEMEAYSVEDNGEGISFHVYCYNVQPDIKIDYTTGESSLISENK